MIRVGHLITKLLLTYVRCMVLGNLLQTPYNPRGNSQCEHVAVCKGRGYNFFFWCHAVGDCLIVMSLMM